jgi:hypothetical protein
VKSFSFCILSGTISSRPLIGGFSVMEAGFAVNDRETPAVKIDTKLKTLFAYYRDRQIESLNENGLFRKIF